MSLDFLRVNDFSIKKIVTKEGDEVELVGLKWGVATDPSFIAMMVKEGVLPQVDYNKQEQEEKEE